jgi:hypothetical protein
MGQGWQGIIEDSRIEEGDEECLRTEQNTSRRSIATICLSNSATGEECNFETTFNRPVGCRPRDDSTG